MIDRNLFCKLKVVLDFLRIVIDKSFDWSVEKSHCQINVVGRYVLISEINFYLFPRRSFERGRFIKAIENFFPVIT